MLATRESKWIIRLIIETSDHHASILREIFRLRGIDEVYEGNSWFPLTRRCRSLISDCLRKCNTLTTISDLRKLGIFTISWIYYRTWIGIICHNHKMFHINRLIWLQWIVSTEYFTSWYNSTLPVSCRDTSIIPWKCECKWGLDEWHRIIDYWTIVPHHSTTENHFLSNLVNFCSGICLYSLSGFATINTRRRESGVGVILSFTIFV